MEEVLEYFHSDKLRRMTNMWKKFWHWLRMEDEKKWIVGVNDLRYSECIKRFPLKESMTLDDILHISHKKEDGSYETCYITVKQLKDAIVNL